MAISLVPTETNIFRIVQSIRQIIQGRSDATLEVTLTPNAATTVVTAINCGKDSIPFWSPKTANAAAALTGMWYSDVVQGGFTLHHANNAQVDRSFGVICLGG